MNDTMKRILEELNSPEIEEFLSDKNTPTPSKSYKPTKKRIESFRDEKNINEMHIRGISPYHAELTAYAFVIENIFKDFFGFNQKQIGLMNESVKEEVIECGVIGLRKSFWLGRNHFLKKGIVFEEYYKENKLKLLIELGKEPTIVSEEDYLFIEEKFIMLMKATMNAYFQTEETVVNKKYLSTQYAKDLMIGFFISLMEKLEEYDSTIEYKIYRYYFDKLSVGFDEPEIEMYRKGKWCPLTRNMFAEETTIDSFLTDVKLGNLSIYSVHLKMLQVLLKENDYESLLNTLLLVILQAKSHIQNRNELSALFESKDGKRFMKDIVSNLSKYEHG